MIKISIITPVYNAEKYLRQTLLSIQNQHADDSKAARKDCDARFVGRSRSVESDLVFGVS